MAQTTLSCYFLTSEAADRARLLLRKVTQVSQPMQVTPRRGMAWVVEAEEPDSPEMRNQIIEIVTRYFGQVLDPDQL
jgi:hypothetical protein